MGRQEPEAAAIMGGDKESLSWNLGTSGIYWTGNSEEKEDVQEMVPDEELNQDYCIED